MHGSQSIAVAGPIPTAGSATLRTRISDVWDKGRAAVIWQEGVATSETGEALWTTRSSIFVRGEGGWGGDRGSSQPVAVPDRAPDADTTYDVTPQQALLYRLCGDRNPLHADPDFAKAAGFPAPILHGLCSYGIVLRTVTDDLLDGDASRVAAFTARFAGVVFPGETIRVRAWREDAGIVVSATVARRGRARRRARAGRLPADAGLTRSDVLAGRVVGGAAGGILDATAPRSPRCPEQEHGQDDEPEEEPEHVHHRLRLLRG